MACYRDCFIFFICCTLNILSVVWSVILMSMLMIASFMYLNAEWNCVVIAFLRRFCQIASRFHFFEFRKTDFFYRARSSALGSTPPWRTRSQYLCPPGTGWSSCTPRHRFPFSSLTATCRATVKVIEPASIGRAIAQAVSRWLPTPTARVRARV
jgi:hypothetical protein